MLPFSIRRKITTLRLWESFLRLWWGAGRWIALVLALLAMACGVDWLIDRFMPTPWPVRITLFGGQILAGAVAIVVWLLVPMVRRMSNGAMALLVEENKPSLKHRLISVVQFHRRGADTRGMSDELINRVTDETTEQTAGMSFLGAADPRRLLWALLVVVPVVLLVLVPILLWPETARALLSRQALLDVEIPRSIYLKSISEPVRPIGEELVLRFHVRGTGVRELTRESRGEVRIYPEGLPSETFTLKPEATPAGDEGVFIATIPPGYADFSYRAWLSDGRTEQLTHMKLVARPVIEKIEAWTVLPKTVGLRPSGQPYEIKQSRGEIVAIKQSSAKVRVDIQKPVTTAMLHILGPKPPLETPQVMQRLIGVSGVSGSSGPRALLAILAGKTLAMQKFLQHTTDFETIIDEVPMTVAGSQAEAIFPLPEQASGYRIIVKDEYNFRNIPAPRRSIRIVPEEAPQVALLPEQFPPDDFFARELKKSLQDFYIEGAPVPVGSRFRVAYTFTGPYGLGAARFHYRIFKKPAGDEVSPTEIEEPNWIVVPLKEKLATAEAGPFLLPIGAFANSPPNESIDFHAIPSTQPETQLGRLEGGGRFDIELKNLPDGAGKFLLYTPQPGDQIEYFIEVSADKEFHPLRPTARSEVRLKSVVTPGEAILWVMQAGEEERRIRQLHNKQTGVFGK